MTLVGPSGSGKTTMLRILGLMDLSESERFLSIFSETFLTNSMSLEKFLPDLIKVKYQMLKKNQDEGTAYLI